MVRFPTGNRRFDEVNGVIVIRYHAAARAVTSQKRLYASAGNTTSNAIPEGNLIYWMWERLPSTGLGARALADMAGKRPLRALGPMMSALNFRFLFFKKKEERKTHNPPKFRIFEA